MCAVEIKQIRIKGNATILEQICKEQIKSLTIWGGGGGGKSKVASLGKLKLQSCSLLPCAKCMLFAMMHYTL